MSGEYRPNPIPSKDDRCAGGCSLWRCGRTLDHAGPCAPAVPVFQLLQWKYAIKLEAVGLRHSSGRSVRAHAARRLCCKRAEVAAVIARMLESYEATR